VKLSWPDYGHGSMAPAGVRTRSSAFISSSSLRTFWGTAVAKRTFYTATSCFSRWAAICQVPRSTVPPLPQSTSTSSAYRIHTPPPPPLLPYPGTNLQLGSLSTPSRRPPCIINTPQHQPSTLVVCRTYQSVNTQQVGFHSFTLTPPSLLPEQQLPHHAVGYYYEFNGGSGSNCR
jgi:hypothetical protein